MINKNDWFLVVCILNVESILPRYKMWDNSYESTLYVYQGVEIYLESTLYVWKCVEIFLNF